MRFSVFLVLLWASLAGAESILHRGNGAEPETLDVHRSSGVPEATIQRDLFEGLLTEGADGALLPGVAERWQVSADGLVYRFELRADARWSDGEPVVAGDFVYAIRRALAPETASDYAFILWPIANAEGYSKGETRDPTALGVSAPDPRTLEIRLGAPTPYFLDLLTHHMSYPVPRRAIEAHGNQWTRPGNLISNGAYRLAEWVPQSHIKLVRNEQFHSAATVAINVVTYYPTEDKNSELKRFRAGELDITEDVPSAQIQWVEAQYPEAFRNAPYNGVYYLAFNLTRPPFRDDAKLRRALTLAIDREILTAKVTRGGELPAWSWVPAGVRAYAPANLPEATLDKSAREDLARRLYAESGYDKGRPLSVELLYNTSDNHKKIAIAVAAMWKQVLGVKTRLRNEEWKVYLDSRKRRAFEIIRGGWIGDYNDAYSFLGLLKSDIGDMNPSAYINPRFDALIAESERTLDTARRAALMQQAERLLLEDLPVIPLYHYTTQHLVSPRVQGWVDNIMDVHPTRWLSFR